MFQRDTAVTWWLAILQDRHEFTRYKFASNKTERKVYVDVLYKYVYCKSCGKNVYGWGSSWWYGLFFVMLSVPYGVTFLRAWEAEVILRTPKNVFLFPTSFFSFSMNRRTTVLRTYFIIWCSNTDIVIPWNNKRICCMIGRMIPTTRYIFISLCAWSVFLHKLSVINRTHSYIDFCSH